MAKQKQIERLIIKETDVPTLPHAILQVMQMIQDPHCSSSELARVIINDPGLATKVLRRANSPYYGFRQKIGDIGQAVTLLGFAAVTNTLLSTAVFDLFCIAGTGFDMPGLWKHSIATATAAKILAKHTHYPHSEKAFTAGLLHDIGKVMIARAMPSSLRLIVTLVQTKNLSMLEAEKKVLGVSHPAFGGLVMTRWEFPNTLIEAVKWHHSPTQAQTAFDLTAVVYLANIIAHESGIGSGGDRQDREIDPQILAYFQISPAVLTEVAETLQRKRLEIEAFAMMTNSV